MHDLSVFHMHELHLTRYALIEISC